MKLQIKTVACLLALTGSAIYGSYSYADNLDSGFIRVVKETQIDDKATKKEQEKADKLAKAQAKEAEKARKEAAKKAEKARKEAEKKAEKEAKAAAKRAEQESKTLAKQSTQEMKAILPIFVKNGASTPIAIETNAILDGDQTLIPLHTFRQVTPWAISANTYETTYTITIPGLRAAGDYFYIDDMSNKQSIRLPYVTVNGEKYVDLNSMSTLSGVSFQLDLAKGGKAGQILLDVAPTRLLSPQKQTLIAPIGWAFDPLVDSDIYKQSLSKQGSSIISPSWYNLGDTGLELSSKLKRDYVKSYKALGYRVWPLVGNKFNSTFTHKVLNTESLWSTYAQQLAMYALLYGYDGYNFDFEDIQLRDKAQLTKFTSFLADYLRNFGIYSSIDVTGYSDSPNWSLVYDRKGLADAVDYVVFMAYDETWSSSTKSGPVASYPWVKMNAVEMLKEVPANKLVLGIPFYTRKWTETKVGSAVRAKAKTLSIIDSRAVLEEHKNDIVWDDTLKTNYLAVPDTVMSKSLQNKKGENIRIWFEDEKSLGYKMRLMNELKLAGFAAWRKGFEDTMIIDTIKNESESTGRRPQHKRSL